MIHLNGTDAYPSRTSDEVTLFQRHDPVVHGAADDGPLTQDLLDEFDACGYVHMDDVFSAGEVAAMSSQLDMVEPRPEVPSIFALPTVSGLLGQVLRDPRLVDVARQIVGSDVYLHQSRVNDTPGVVGTTWEWHSDFETWHVEDGMPRPRAVSVSITLRRQHGQSGPLLIIPGSHWTFVTCGVSGDPLPDTKSLTILADRHGIASCGGAAGAVTFFDANAMHGSNGKVTPTPRSSVFAVYNSVENSLEDPFGPNAPRPEWVASRQFTPLSSSTTPSV